LFGSLPVGRLFGITVRVHWMWVAMLLLIPFSLDGRPLQNVVGFLVLFGIVLLHELGHALVARRFRIRTLDITLWPLGGMARMEHIPERPGVEFWIALAGPLVNFGLAALGGAAMFVLFVVEESVNLGATAELAYNALFAFTAANLVIGGFNLIPAFPMDGGRIFRAFLAVFVDWLRATSIAVQIGRLFAFALITIGVLGWLYEWPQTMFLPLLGVFLWLAGARELLSVRIRRAQSAEQAAAFGVRPGENAAAAAPRPRPAAAPTDPSGARRPEVASIDGAARRTLTAEDLERLERYRGRLRPRERE